MYNKNFKNQTKFTQTSYYIDFFLGSSSVLLKAE